MRPCTDEPCTRRLCVCSWNEGGGGWGGSNKPAVEIRGKSVLPSGAATSGLLSCILGEKNARSRAKSGGLDEKQTPAVCERTGATV